MTAKESKERIEPLFDHIERRDFDAIAALIRRQTHPDVVFTSAIVSGLDGRTFHGQEELIAYFADLLDTIDIVYSDRAWEAINPDLLLFICTVEMQGRGSGAPAKAKIGQVYELKDDLVLRSTSYTDEDQARAAAEALTHA